MTVQLQRTTLQTWLLATAALTTATVQSIVIQEPDTWTLCDQNNGSCDWPSDNSVAIKRRASMDELLAQLANSPSYSSHITRQLASYSLPATSSYAYSPLRPFGLHEQLEQQHQQPPFLSGNWKRQLVGLGGLTTWDAYGPSGPTRLHRPLNGDKRARYAFSSWGGKRSLAPAQPNEIGATFDGASLNTKREPAFSSWGGKRSHFFNWGGKRGIPEETLDRIAAEEHPVDGEHAVMKRAVSGEDVRAVVATDGEPSPVSKRLCISDPTNLRQLLDEFVEWSRKQSEQKKASLYSKIMNVRTLRGSESPSTSRRAGAFYPWGGKRNSKLKDD